MLERVYHKIFETIQGLTLHCHSEALQYLMVPYSTVAGSSIHSMLRMMRRNLAGSVWKRL